MSDEFRKKTSERMKNRIVSEETKTKISLARTGSKHSEVTISKISNSVSEYYTNNKIIWVQKEDESKRILEIELSEYLLLGWKRGRGKLPRS